MKPQNVTLAVEEKSGLWQDISVDSKGIQKGKCFTLYVDHGKDCSQKETLGYIVTPASDIQKFSSFFSDCGHAVKNESGSFVFAAFFAPGKMEIPGTGAVSCNKKAAVMIKEKTVSVSDVQQCNKILTVSLNGKPYIFDLPQGVHSGKSVVLSK